MRKSRASPERWNFQVLSIPSNWEEKAEMSSRWETELEPGFRECQNRCVPRVKILIPYLIGREAPVVPRKPGVQQVLAIPEVRSKTLSRSKEPPKVRWFRGRRQSRWSGQRRSVEKKNVSLGPHAHTHTLKSADSSIHQSIISISISQMQKKRRRRRSVVKIHSSLLAHRV